MIRNIRRDLIEIDNIDLNKVVEAKTGTPVLELEQVFKLNAERGVVIPEHKFKDLYSMQGIQNQINEVYRNLFYQNHEGIKLSLGAILYYYERYDDGRNEIKSFTAILDSDMVRANAFRDKLLDQTPPDGWWAVAWLLGNGMNPPNQTRDILRSKYKREIGDKFKDLQSKVKQHEDN